MTVEMSFMGNGQLGFLEGMLIVPNYKTRHYCVRLNFGHVNNHTFLHDLPLIFRGSIYAWFPAHAASCLEALNHTEFSGLV